MGIVEHAATRLGGGRIRGREVMRGFIRHQWACQILVPPFQIFPSLSSSWTWTILRNIGSKRPKWQRGRLISLSLQKSPSPPAKELDAVCLLVARWWVGVGNEARIGFLATVKSQGLVHYIRLLHWPLIY